MRHPERKSHSRQHKRHTPLCRSCDPNEATRPSNYRSNGYLRAVVRDFSWSGLSGNGDAKISRGMDASDFYTHLAPA